MILSKTKQILLYVSIVNIFTACSTPEVPKSKGGYYYSHIYFGSYLSSFYKLGIVDGCITAKGDYRKSHRLFRENNDYQNGWFLGRNKCKDLLVVKNN